MNLTTALQQAKVLNDRIESAIRSSVHVGVVTGEKEKPANGRFTNKQELETQIKSDLQSVQALIARRNAIRGGIVIANATTKVKIGETEMTIAEAVERKRNVYLEQLALDAMRSAYATALKDVDQKTRALDATVLELVTKQYQGENQGKPPTQDQIESTKTIQYKQYGPALVNPLDLNKLIPETEAALQKFLDNVDNELSRINSNTEITIEY